MLEADGWIVKRQRGSHRVYTHPVKPNLVVVPVHTGDLKIGTERKVLKEAGLL